LAILGLASFVASAQSASSSNPLIDFGARWQARATKTQAEQPKWAVPMYSPFPMVAQVFRLDYTRQRMANASDNWNIGGNKGFNFIPFARTQIDVFFPGYVLHGDGGQDGFSDTSVVAKYRFASVSEKRGNYIASASVGFSFPTGSYRNGTPSAVITPALHAGKGFGKLALFSSLGSGLPTSQTATSGRTILWNSVAQYKVRKYFTPELELNSTTYAGGTRDGKTQMFLSPGLMVGRLPLRRSDAGSRIGLTFGIAFQTAISSYYTYNHGLAITTRFNF
jgi:hypothetical protein